MTPAVGFGIEDLLPGSKSGVPLLIGIKSRWPASIFSGDISVAFPGPVMPVIGMVGGQSFQLFGNLLD